MVWSCEVLGTGVLLELLRHRGLPMPQSFPGGEPPSTCHPTSAQVSEEGAPSQPHGGRGGPWKSGAPGYSTAPTVSGKGAPPSAKVPRSGLALREPG